MFMYVEADFCGFMWMDILFSYHWYERRDFKLEAIKKFGFNYTRVRVDGA